MSKQLKLISLGARGVGKTVFLVNSCAIALQEKNKNLQGSWFECQDPQSLKMVTNLLKYIEQNRAYPPATFKISNFNLSLKTNSLGETQTICDIQWKDIPGEWCDLNNPNFQSALLESHGCCIFVDSEALLNQPSYTEELAQNIKQVEAITSLIHQNNLVRYPIALICTKYDLIQSNSIGLIQLEEQLKPLIKQLEANQSISQRFYSGIPLLQSESGIMSQTTNADEALRWITTELNEIHPSDNPQNLGQVLKMITEVPIENNSEQTVPTPAAPKNSKKALNLALVICGVIAAAGGLFLTIMPKTVGPATDTATAKSLESFKAVLKDDPTNESAISGIIKIYSDELRQEDKAISLLESLHSKNPTNLNILVSLAQLYEIQGDIEKQEVSLDKVLKLDKINLAAIQSKVRLKVENNKPQEARDVINQAKKHAKTPAFKAILQELLEDIPD